MAMSIDWATLTFTIPQTDLTPVVGALYDFDTDVARLELKAIEASEDGIAFLRTHNHNTEVTIAGVTYARTIEMLNGYSITFEDTGFAYAVRFINSNNNLWDVENNILNVTPKVSYIPTNSAGLIIAETGTSGLTPAESQALLDIDTNVDGLVLDVADLETAIDLLTASQDLTNAQKAAEHTTDPVLGKVILRNTTTSERWEADAWEDADQLVAYKGEGLESVGMLTSVAWS
jgi:hypothetical protein